MIQNIKLYLLENNTGQIPGVKENPRDLTGDGFAKAKQSIKDFPEMLEVRTLVVVKHGEMFVVIGGNQRLRAMRDLDYDNAPVMVVDWPVDKINEFIIKDNVEYGVWNFDLLANEWDSNLLVDWGMNLPVEFGDVEEPLEGLTDEDATPEPPELPKTKLGDIWICGKHRVMCGDSTSIDAVERLMDGQAPNTMVTDPPYGVKLDQSWRDKALGGKALGKGNSNIVANDERADWYDVWALFQGNVAYVWHASSFTDVVMDSLRRADFEVKQQIIWNKSVMVMGRSDYHFKHEPCWYAIRKNKNHNWIGDRKQTTIWDAAPPNHIMGGSDEEKTTHPTQKPAVLYEKAYLNHTNMGEYTYEPFGGSGTALVVCEKIGRRSLTMELDPKYVDVIIKRWQDFTGKDAILESTQQKFNEL